MNYNGRLEHIAKLHFLTTFCYVFDGANWAVEPLLKEPITINYTIDDSSDNAVIEFLSASRDTKIPNGTLITLVYNNNGIPAYTGGKPNNHDVYLIRDGSCVKTGSYYLHKYTLVELIEVTKNIALETMTFTSDTQVTVKYVGESEVTYYKAPYNAYTILDRLLKHSPSITQSKDAVEIDNSWYTKIAIMDSAWLQTELIGVDDTFQENTLYDALIKLGSYLDRYPVLYLNSAYNGSNAMWNLYFERRVVNKSTPVQLSSLLTNAIDIVQSDQSSVAKKIISNAKNVIGSRVIYWPSEGQYASAINKADEAIQVTPTSELKIVLDNPISEVVEITQLRYQEDTYFIGEEPFVTYTETYTPIQCFKYQDWLVQDDRNNKAYFKENENVIYFGPGIKNTDQDYIVEELRVSYFYNVKAYTNIGLQIVKGTGDYSQFLNQTDNMIDGGSYGKLLDNYAKANSGMDYTFSKLVETYAEILPCGQLVVDGTDEYMIAKVSFNTFIDKGYQRFKVAYGLNKDFVRRNLFIKGNQGIRKYQTYYENVYDRMMNISEDVFVSVRFGAITSDLGINSFNYIANKDVVMGGLLSNVDDTPEEMPQTCVLEGTTETFTNAGLTMSTSITKHFQLNTNKTQVGNSVVVNIKALDNTSVGYKVTQPNSSGVQVQSPTIYTNPFGNLKFLQLGLANKTEISTIADNYPIIDYSVYATLYGASMVKIPYIDLDKDSRETLNISLQFNYKGYGKTELHDDFIYYSGLLGEREFTAVTVESVQYLEDLFYIVGLTGAEIGDVTSTVGARIIAINKGATYIRLDTGTNVTYATTNDYFIAKKMGSVYKLICKIDNTGAVAGDYSVFTISY